MRKNHKTCLIMPKYFLFMQCREQIKGSRIAKHNLDLIIHFCLISYESDIFSLSFLFFKMKQANLKV